MVRVSKVDATRASFTAGFRRLPREIKTEAARAIADLEREPLPARLRFEKLSSYQAPAIYTVHVTSNHSHKLSFELIGDTAILRKIGTHKEIDRAP